MKRVLVGGGARCGKSAFALRRARELGVRRVFVATAEAGDAEMAARIARHVRERGPEWRTLECPIELEEAFAGLRDVDVVLIDCLTFWISNLLCRGLSAETPLGRAFRDVAGRAHQLLAAGADEVYFGVMGQILRLKPGPVEVA